MVKILDAHIALYCSAFTFVDLSSAFVWFYEFDFF